MKCVAWFPQGLHLFISLLLGFFTPDIGLCVLSAFMGFMLFVESFVTKALHEDVNIITNIPMLINPQCFVMPNSLVIYYIFIHVFMYFVALC
jgi:hypothetical protein